MVALVGTTASGKSSLAMAAARRLGDVEILCVDSMTVYRGMDIGTSKPSPADRAAVAHHMLDLVDPDAEFTVSDFQAKASSARAGIASRGQRALLVGGTGLYLRAVVDDLDIPARYPDVAEALERDARRPGGIQELHARLAVLDPVAASRTTDTNRRRIVRALEVTLGSGRPFSSYGPGLGAYPPTDVVMLGLPFVPELVDRRIEERFARWMDEGLVEEVRRLSARPGGLSRTARQALGYRELLDHVERGAPLETCVREAVRRTRAFARRQRSWFRRDPRVRWIAPHEDPEDVLVAALGGARRRAGARLVTMVPAAAPRPTSEASGACEASEAREASGAIGAIGAIKRRTRTIAMTKLEAAGNDFLVVLGRSRHEPLPLTPSHVRALCDRHRGIGADGLIFGRPAAAPADLEMVLHNADGSEAEMSGNGIRCLVHAAVLAGLVAPGVVHVATAAGRRTVSYEPGADGRAWARVDMGGVRLGREVESLLPGTRARLADVGNPHLVVIGDLALDAVDLEALGVAATHAAGRPVNLEVARPGHTGADLELRVLERGVGETLACGTGTCAVAAVARAFGMVGSVVRVDNPGGRLEVRLGTAARATRDPSAGSAPVVSALGGVELGGVELGGPVRKVADVEVDTSFFASTGGEG